MTPTAEAAKAQQEKLERLLEEDRRVVEASREQRGRQRVQARRVERALQEAKSALRRARRS